MAYTYTSSATAIATVTAAGVVTAVAPGTATITVSAAGTGTGFAATTLTTASTITVTALPQGITALNVQPTTLAIALGSTAQLAASAQQPSGAAAATITYGTTVPGVATVSTSGLVTAVAPGTAVITVTATSAANAQFAAATLTQLVPVTVSPSANVTIQTVTQGPIATSYADGLITAPNTQTNLPIDIANVRDQIQVVLNLEPNGQKVDSAVIFIANADGTNRRAAARQIFSNGTANAGNITLFVNTADFTANFTTGAADVFYPNGQKVISASVFTSQANGSNPTEVQNAQNNRQVVNFNNLDSYAARYVSPTRSQVGTGNLTWWGGPGTEGTGSYAIVPVFYSAGRSVTRIDIGLRQGVGASTAQICNQSGQVVSSLAGTALQTGDGISAERYTALPFNGTYNNAIGRMTLGTGSSTSFSTAANGNIECRGHVHANSATAQNFVAVEAGTDNFNNPAPIVTRFDGYRTSAQVAAIVPNRLDYAGPETVEPDIRRTGPGQNGFSGYPSLSVSNATWSAPAVTGWVNATFNFQTQTPASTESNGVGLPTTTSRSWRFWGCNAGQGGSLPTTDTVSVAVPTTTGSDIPECSVNNQGGWIPTSAQTGTASSTTYNLWTRGPYRIGYIETDLLGNANVSPRSAPFGVDRTAPLIRLASASAADTASGTASRGIQAEVIDERAGFIDSNDEGAVLRLNATNAYALATANFGSFQHFASRGASSANPAILARANASNINCINPTNGSATINSSSDPFNTSLSTSSFTGFGANPITAPTCQWISQPATALGGMLSDGYRPATPVTFSADGIYTYRARIFDRAGNPVQAPVGRTYAVEAAAAPTVSDLNVPASITASANPTFGTVASANVEVRAYNVSVAYPSIANRFVYPQTLLNARFDDVVGSQYTGTVALPTPAPMVTALEALGSINVPAFSNTTVSLTSSNIANINTTMFNTANTATTSANVGFGAVSLPSLSGIANVNGNSTTPNFFTTWRVMNLVADFQPGFNAPQGLKAQLRGNTNVPNPPFVRTDFYRLDAATNQYEYLGSASSASQTDIGSDRYWTWTLTSDLYAKSPTSLETNEPLAALNDNIIAVGVRSTGAGLATQPTVIGGSSINFFGITQVAASAGACSSSNAICFVQPPAGFPQIGTAAANISVNGLAPSTLSATISGAGILPVDAAGGTYAFTLNSVVINGVTYTPTIAAGTTLQNAPVAANQILPLPFRIIYQPVLVGATVSSNLPAGGFPISVTLTGTSGAANGIAVGPVSIATNGQLIPLPATGTYTAVVNSPSTINVGNQNYNTPVVTYPAAATSATVGGSSTPTITVTYALFSAASSATLNLVAGAPFTAETFAAGSVSIPVSATNGGVVSSPNPIVTAFGGFTPTGTTLTTTATFGLPTFGNLTVGTPTGTYTATLASASYPLNISANQSTIFGPVYNGGSSVFGGASTAAVQMFPAQLTINVTGTASPTTAVSPANWVIASSTLTGPNGYSQPYTGGAGPTYTGFQSLQIGGTARTVILPVASPGVGSYQLSVPNTQVIGGTTFTVNCTTSAGAAVLSAAVSGSNCLFAINATYGSTPSAITVSYSAP